MSEDYDKNGEISSFTVNTDRSILQNNKDAQWLQYDHNQGIYVKKFIVVPTDGDV
jgi:hypothetical protein